ncbi:MAG: nucleoside deaminase [Caldimicrobium sp.]|nr:nucleoside deaminase [Caldimicrobium sp.]MCX7613484.1 nucleoside deaminase [Caldimicrobium sp.]MDW8182944.1 nucleoside deaminase [Caldimicrobium sp.]
MNSFYFTKDDFEFMAKALYQAQLAFEEDEVPVGAVLVSSEGEILAETRNLILKLCDPTAHAEILAIREGAKKCGNYRLIGCKLYVTLEPCPMCTYATVLARLDEIVFATPDPKTGACKSLYQIASDLRLNHQIKIRWGLYEEEASLLLKKFFQERRKF